MSQKLQPLLQLVLQPVLQLLVQPVLHEVLQPLLQPKSHRLPRQHNFCLIFVNRQHEPRSQEPQTDAVPQHCDPLAITGAGPAGEAVGTGSAPARHAENNRTAAFTGNDLRKDRWRGRDVAGSPVSDRTSCIAHGTLRRRAVSPGPSMHTRVAHQIEFRPSGFATLARPQIFPEPPGAPSLRGLPVVRVVLKRRHRCGSRFASRLIETDDSNPGR